MLNIAICDDNISFSSVLIKMVSDLCFRLVPEKADYRILSTFSSAAELMEYTDKNEISILFLDIDMPETNGFEAARYIREKHQETEILFMSNFDDLVFGSFEFSPFRFLRKSKLREELPEALEKVIEKCTSDLESAVFNTVDGEQIIRYYDITYIEGSGNYYLVNTTSGKQYKCRGSLNDAETMLDAKRFYRIQQSYIVNFNSISCVDKNAVVMRSGERFNVSRRNQNDFRQYYLRMSRKDI